MCSNNNNNDDDDDDNNDNSSDKGERNTVLTIVRLFLLSGLLSRASEGVLEGLVLTVCQRCVRTWNNTIPPTELTQHSEHQPTFSFHAVSYRTKINQTRQNSIKELGLISLQPLCQVPPACSTATKQHQLSDPDWELGHASQVIGRDQPRSVRGRLWIQHHTSLWRELEEWNNQVWCFHVFQGFLTSLYSDHSNHWDTTQFHQLQAVKCGEFFPRHLDTWPVARVRNSAMAELTSLASLRKNILGIAGGDVPYIDIVRHKTVWTTHMISIWWL